MTRAIRTFISVGRRSCKAVRTASCIGAWRVSQVKPRSLLRPTLRQAAAPPDNRASDALPSSAPIAKRRALYGGECIALAIGREPHASHEITCFDGQAATATPTAQRSRSRTRSPGSRRKRACHLTLQTPPVRARVACRKGCARRASFSRWTEPEKQACDRIAGGRLRSGSLARYGLAEQYATRCLPRRSDSRQ